MMPYAFTCLAKIVDKPWDYLHAIFRFALYHRILGSMQCTCPSCISDIRNTGYPFEIEYIISMDALDNQANSNVHLYTMRPSIVIIMPLISYTVSLSIRQTTTFCLSPAVDAPCDYSEAPCCTDGNHAANCVLDGNTGKWQIVKCQTGCSAEDGQDIACEMGPD